MSRRIYAQAKKLVRKVLNAGLFVIAPFFGAVILKMAWGLASTILIYGVLGLLPGKSPLTDFGGTLIRAMAWTAQERPSIWWLLPGLVITWPFVLLVTKRSK